MTPDSSHPEKQDAIENFFKKTPTPKSAEPEPEVAAEASAADAAPAAAPRCGKIAIVGRPNVGKSTLMNALVGQKVSITSRKAQTTRHRITGIRNKDASQFVFVDTPGFQTRHANALNKTLNKTVTGALPDVDLVFFVVEAGNFGLGDAKVLSLLPTTTPVVLLANKLDQIKRRAELMTWLADMQTRHPFAEIVPLSAKKPADMERLLDIAQHYLPEQAWVYQDGELSDLKTFNLKEGLTFLSGTREMSVANVKEWIGERAGAGKLPPNGFPRSNRFQ